MARPKVSYEWGVELSDRHGDIIHIDHGDKLSDVWGDYVDPNFSLDKSIVMADLVLYRELWCEDEGRVDQLFCYAKDGKRLPEFFSFADGNVTSHKVPKKYLAECKKIKGW